MWVETSLLAGEISRAARARQTGWTWVFLPVKQVIPVSPRTGAPTCCFVRLSATSESYFDVRVFVLWTALCVVLTTVGVVMSRRSLRVGLPFVACGVVLAQAPLLYTFWGAGGVGAAWRISAGGLITGAAGLVLCLLCASKHR